MERTKRSKYRKRALFRTGWWTDAVGDARSPIALTASIVKNDVTAREGWTLFVLGRVSARAPFPISL